MPLRVVLRMSTRRAKTEASRNKSYFGGLRPPFDRKKLPKETSGKFENTMAWVTYGPEALNVFNKVVEDVKTVVNRVFIETSPHHTGMTRVNENLYELREQKATCWKQLNNSKHETTEYGNRLKILIHCRKVFKIELAKSQKKENKDTWNEIMFLSKSNASKFWKKIRIWRI